MPSMLDMPFKLDIEDESVSSLFSTLVRSDICRMETKEEIEMSDVLRQLLRRLWLHSDPLC